MVAARDRHGRGLRGPLAQSNPITGQAAAVKLRLSRVEFFRRCVEGSISRIKKTCPAAIEGVAIGIEQVPTQAAIWQGLTDHDAIPLAGAIEGDDQPARIALYQRSLERQALDRDDLAMLIHQTLVEQLSSLTGRSTIEIDPTFDDD